MSSTDKAEPSARIVLQRVRNRIIEYLELVGSFEAQREYQERVPFTVVPELINQWEDWVVSGWESSYVEPTFSEDERAEISRFARLWSEVADRLPEPLPFLTEVQRTNDWLRLREAGARALDVFLLRGRLPEDEQHG